jgi:hypothetical protein
MRKRNRFSNAVLIAILAAAGAALSAAPAESIVIGCLQRTGANVYSLKDDRSGVSFVIEADGRTPEKTLAWQVGHALEIHGIIAAAPAAGQSQHLRANTVLEIATTCRPAPAK